MSERPRANRRFAFGKDKTRLSETLLFLRTAKKHNAQSKTERQMGCQHKKTGDLLKTSTTSNSEDNPTFQLEPIELPHDAESTILVRKHVRGSKLESVFPSERS